jgi:hypothetical protein
VVHAISEATEIDEQVVKAMMSEATFMGESAETLWGKPFVYAGGAARFVFAAALKSSVLRGINQLINSYADNHGRKGIFFQEFCREHIRAVIRDGLLSNDTWVSPRSVETSAGDIDICVVVGSKILVLEVKYIPFPSDAHEYWRVDQTIAKAVDQVRRKVATISGDVGSFLKFIRERYAAPDKADGPMEILPLIVVSDPYHAGFPVDGVGIADLEILDTYFSNRVLQQQQVSAEGLRSMGRYLFKTKGDAIAGMRAYFESPEITTNLRAHIERREIDYPTDIMIGEKEIRVKLVGTGLRIGR